VQLAWYHDKDLHEHVLCIFVNIIAALYSDYFWLIIAAHLMLNIYINYIGCPKHPDFISCLAFYALMKNMHAIVCFFFAKQ